MSKNKKGKEDFIADEDWKITVDSDYEPYHGTHERTIITMHSGNEGVAIALTEQQAKDLIKILVDQL